MRIKLPRLKVTQKALYLLLVITLMPSIIIGIVSYQLTKTALWDEAVSHSQLLVTSTNNTVSSLLDLAQRISDQLEDEFSSSTEFDLSNDNEFAIREVIDKILEEYPSLSEYVSVNLTSSNGKEIQFGNNDRECSFKSGTLKNVSSQSLIKSNDNSWVDADNEIGLSCNAPGIVHYVNYINANESNAQTGEQLSLIIVNTDLNKMVNDYQAGNINGNGYLIILDENNKILYHLESELLGTNYEQDLVFNYMFNNRDLVKDNSGKNFLYSSTAIEGTGWELLYFDPYDTVIIKSSVVGIVIFFMIIILTGILFLITNQISKTFIYPIEEITDRLKLFHEDSPDWQRPLEVRSNDEFGSLTKWFNIFQDAMRQKAVVENGLKISEERYSLAINGAKDGIWDWNFTNNKIFFSTRWKSILGFKENEFGDSPEAWFDRVHPEDIHRLRADIICHLEGGTEYFENEHRILHKDNETYFWIHARGLAIRDGDNNAVRMAGSISDVTERKEFEERLIHDAMHDALTQLPNRSYFLDILRRTIERSKRYPNYKAAVIIVDLDRFKIINDSLGHAAGDELLIETANKLSQCLRSGGDVIARIGGDEFALLLDDIQDIYDATRIAKRLQLLLSQPINIKGQNLTSSASIGIVLTSQGYNQAEELLRDADTAMYRAKSNGRSRYEVFGSEMHTQTVSLLRLEVGLRRAIETEEFVLHYQPIVTLADGKASSVEALIRWAHPGRGLIYPDQFIGLAEETGLIIPIGEWVLNKACRDCQQWHNEGLSDISVSVNISASQLQNKGFINQVQGALERSKLDGKYLILEITESIAMHDIDHSIQLLTELNKMGVTISIDDFGTSYSSLEYLKRFPVHNLKIDKSFIHELTVNQDDAAIANAIIAMAHILGLQAIAEGVETKEQLSILTDLNCDCIQGFFISSPVSELEVKKILRQKEPVI